MQDLISRQAAIDALDEQITQCDKALGSFDISMKDEYAVKVERASLKAYRETLNVLPSVQPRKGKWIYGESEIGNDGYYCSMCGNFVPWKYDEYDIDFIKEFLFCNKCGASMRPQFEEPEINPCRGCEDYDGEGGCKTKGGCADRRGDSDE